MSVQKYPLNFKLCSDNDVTEKQFKLLKPMLQCIFNVNIS